MSRSIRTNLRKSRQPTKSSSRAIGEHFLLFSGACCALFEFDERAVVAFFPSDHYYTQEEKFIAGIASGYELAERNTQDIILLGAVADRPETEYGWIEPETPVANRSGNRLTRVRRFWEKPSSEIAKRLLNQGCLWNTFVMVGRASAFLKMIQQTAPIIYRDFESILTQPGLGMEAELMESFYERLPSPIFQDWYCRRIRKGFLSPALAISDGAIWETRGGSSPPCLRPEWRIPGSHRDRAISVA